MYNKIVTVIVPCYNQGQYLSEALDSVLAQTYTQWECIIINDGSTDNTEEIAKAYCGKDQRFQYLYQENQGVVAAKNNAIRHSHGQYILPLDGDDLLGNSFLEEAVAILDTDEEIKIAACRVGYFGDVQGEMKLGDFTLSDLLIRNYMVNTSMFRRDDFDHVGGYKREMARGLEDWELWLSILENGGKVYRIDKILFYYRIHENSRNAIPYEKHSRLKETIIKIHSQLLYNEFIKLYQMYRYVNTSKTYRLAKRIQMIANAFHAIAFWKKGD